MKKNKNPLVSIILPYYKKINFIKKTLASIKSQTYTNYEIIFIYDDECKKDLKEINKLINKNKKIKLIINKINLGAGKSRNIGINLSKGKYISFIDADDFWKKNKLKEQINFFKKNKDTKFLYCNYIKNRNGIKKKVISKKLNTYNTLLYNCDIGLSTVILDKKIIKKNYFPNLKTQEDFATWLRILRTYKINAYNINKNMVIWNNAPNSLSSSLIQKLKDAFYIFHKIEKFNLIKTLYLILILSINSIERKI
jgi:teichuronic acid biosynthesis glycosyltransferase TuaG